MICKKETKLNLQSLVGYYLFIYLVCVHRRQGVYMFVLFPTPCVVPAMELRFDGMHLYPSCFAGPSFFPEDRVSFCSPGWLQTFGDPRALASQVLRLQA